MTIESISDVVGGGTPPTAIPEYWDGPIQWFTPSEIGKSKYVGESEKTLSALGLSKSSAKILPAGTVLLTTRATIGEASIATRSCATNQGFQSLIAKSGTDHEFLYYAIGTKREEMKRRANGSTFAEISNSQVKSLKIFVPCLETETKISRFFALLDSRIEAQNKIIEQSESLIKSIRDNVFRDNNWKWERLRSFIDNKTIELQRGNVIPKHAKDDRTFIYPVYSSSVQRDGLMGYSDSYMFDEELITWSIDGGGDFFLRKKHKYNVTNVCGILKLREKVFDYSFLYEALRYQHSKMVFDYQTKAHPSVIQILYSLPLIPLEEQIKIGRLFDLFYKKNALEKSILEQLYRQKEYLLSHLFI